MKRLLLCLLLLSLSANADPLKKVLKRNGYCSPLQKMIGGCGKKEDKAKAESEKEDKGEIRKARKKAEEKKEEEEADEFLR